MIMPPATRVTPDGHVDGAMREELMLNMPTPTNTRSMAILKATTASSALPTITAPSKFRAVKPMITALMRTCFMRPCIEAGKKLAP